MKNPNGPLRGSPPLWTLTELAQHLDVPHRRLVSMISKSKSPPVLMKDGHKEYSSGAAMGNHKYFEPKAFIRWYRQEMERA